MIDGGFEFVLTDTENRKYVVTTTQDVTIVEGEEYLADTIDYVIVNKQPTTLAVTIADEMVKWNPSDKLVVNGTISSNTAADYAGTSTANFDYASVAYPYSAFYPSYLYSSTGSLRFYPEQPLILHGS